MENYLKENNIDHITGGLYNPQHQGAVEAFNRTIQDFLISAKDHQGKKFCLVDSINDFLIYYNDRRYNTTQMRQFKLMTNMNDEKLLKKVNAIETWAKSKLKTKVFEVNQKVRVSNCIRILYDSIFVKFQPLNKYSKGIKKEI